MADFLVGSRFAGQALNIPAPETQGQTRKSPLGIGPQLQEEDVPQRELTNPQLGMIKSLGAIRSSQSQGGVYAPRRTEKLFD